MLFRADVVWPTWLTSRFVSLETTSSVLRRRIRPDYIRNPRFSRGKTIAQEEEDGTWRPESFGHLRFPVPASVAFLVGKVWKWAVAETKLADGAEELHEKRHLISVIQWIMPLRSAPKSEQVDSGWNADSVTAKIWEVRTKYRFRIHQDLRDTTPLLGTIHWTMEKPVSYCWSLGR